MAVATKNSLKRGEKKTIRTIGSASDFNLSQFRTTNVNRPSAHLAILKGLPFAAVTQLEQVTGLSRTDVGTRVLMIPSSTLARRKTKNELSFIESERLMRFSKLFFLAIELFDGDRSAAIKWFLSPARSFSGESPIDRARTEPGARQVEDLIGRLEQGVFS